MEPLKWQTWAVVLWKHRAGPAIVVRLGPSCPREREQQS